MGSPSGCEIEQVWVALESPTAARAGHGTHPCQGLYHRPAGDAPTVAFIATHYNVDFSEHYLAPLLAARGTGFLGWNTRYRGNEAYFSLEHALIDIGAGVRWLREVAGATTVVLLGNSGGGSLMAAYQSQATEPNLAPGRGAPALPDAVHHLRPADLYVSLNAHPGRPDVLTAWLDPAIVDEHDPVGRDPELDMFDQRHGPPFETEFLARYRAAQVTRNDRITDWAISELDRLATSGARDRLFLLHGVWADPRFVDLTLDPSERVAGCYAGDPARANVGVLGIGRTNTLRSWLSMWSLRESQCRGGPHLGRIGVPSLVVQSTADRGVFPADARAIHAALGSADTELRFVPGEHYFETGGRDDVADLIMDWTSARSC